MKMKKLLVCLVMLSLLVLSSVGAVNADQQDPGSDRLGVVSANDTYNSNN